VLETGSALPAAWERAKGIGNAPFGGRAWFYDSMVE